MEDKTQFFRHMKMLENQCNTKMNQDRYNFYLAKLKDFDLKDVIKALDTLLETETVFPTVKKIKDTIQGESNQSDDLAKVISSRLYNAVMTRKMNISYENCHLYLTDVGDIDLKCFNNMTHFNAVITQVLEQKISLNQLYHLILGKTKFLDKEEMDSIYLDIKNNRKAPKSDRLRTEEEARERQSKLISEQRKTENGKPVNLLTGFLAEWKRGTN